MLHLLTLARFGVVLLSICYGKEETEENFAKNFGRPLSGLEFGLLIDKLNVELRTTDLGVVQYSFIIIICLLFLDDIALLARSGKELQEVLNTTTLFLNKWHLKVNIKKVQF